MDQRLVAHRGKTVIGTTEAGEPKRRTRILKVGAGEVVTSVFAIWTITSESTEAMATVRGALVGGVEKIFPAATTTCTTTEKENRLLSTMTTVTHSIIHAERTSSVSR